MACEQHYLAFVHDVTLTTGASGSGYRIDDELFDSLRRNRAVVEGIVVHCNGQCCGTVHPQPPGMQAHHACVLYSTEFFDAPLTQRVAPSNGMSDVSLLRVGSLADLLFTPTDSNDRDGKSRTVQTYKIPSYSYYKTWRNWIVWCSMSPKLPPGLHGPVVCAAAVQATGMNTNIAAPTPVLPASSPDSANNSENTAVDATTATAVVTNYGAPLEPITECQEEERNRDAAASPIDLAELIGVASSIIGVGVLTGV